MKVMLHGATNMSNYGDYLFAELFYNALRERSIETEFYSHPKYGVSDYFCKYLGYTPYGKTNKKMIQECDALVYISGGYFTEPRTGGLLAELQRAKRYFEPAKYFMSAHKPIYILGVGAGPFSQKLYSRRAKEIIEYSSLVTVRDAESAEYCQEFGISKSIIVTSDTALVVREYLQKKTNVPQFLVENGKKMLLFHIDSNAEVKTRIDSIIRPAVLQFIKNNPEYQLYLTADGKKNATLYNEYELMFKEVNPVVLIYDDPWVLTRQIEKADLIITTKLHMGIVGSSLGRSVVSFPFVPQKTKRFYKQIGEADRCVSLADINQDIVLQMLERYRNERIKISDELIDRARKNLTFLPQD